VGNYDDGTAFHGFLRKTDGTYTSIDPAGSTHTNIKGISGKNIVGDYYDSGTVWRGFLAR